MGAFQGLAAAETRQAPLREGNVPPRGPRPARSEPAEEIAHEIIERRIFRLDVADLAIGDGCEVIASARDLTEFALEREPDALLVPVDVLGALLLALAIDPRREIGDVD